MDDIQYLFKSYLGDLFICATENGVSYIYWKKVEKLRVITSLEEAKGRVGDYIAETVQQLNEYLNGERKTFSIDLDVQGTEFQRRVWNELKKIPYGATLSYSDIAKSVDSPRAVRAVGSANGKNPISIIIPCHRVISKQGKLAGYAGGLDNKKKLLQLEGLEF